MIYMTACKLTMMVDTVTTTTNKEKLVAVTCIHSDQTDRLCLFQFKEKYEDTFVGKTYTYMYSGSFGVHTGMQGNVGSYYKRRSDSFKKDRLGVKLRWLFLFLPCKRYHVANQTYDMWSLLCLKEIGWGPPT